MQDKKNSCCRTTMYQHHDIQELMEVFMNATGGTERWITVYEFRTYFNLDDSCAPAISGYLRRIYRNPSRTGRFSVEKIERIPVTIPQRRIMKRYLVKKRPKSRKNATRGGAL